MSAKTWTYGTSIPADLWGFRSIQDSPYRPVLTARPLSRTLNHAANFGRSAFRVPQLEWLFWRGATWCYATYALVALLARARRCRPLLALAGVSSACSSPCSQPIPRRASATWQRRCSSACSACR